MSGNVLRLVANAAGRQLSTMFPGYFTAAKHNHYADYGYPTEVTFELAYAMYCRNGLAQAGVDKTIGKTWQDTPFLLEKQRDGSQGKNAKETPLEAQIRQRFDDLRFWQMLAEADTRGMVGRYAGIILRFADDLAFDQPVTTVRGGLDGLVEIIPAWEGQLKVAEWDTSPTSQTYGKPKFYQFNESAVGATNDAPRQLRIHPDRIVIWSTDGSLNGRSALEPGFNALSDMEKIRGAGGEGFWKNAKSAPVLEISPEAKIGEMAKAMGIKPEEVADKMNEQVEAFNQGFDKMLMVQGMQAKTLGVSLPSPEHFHGIAAQEFAASMSMPFKILVGMQTGERASTEDAQEWSQTAMSRRNKRTRPMIMTVIRRLERVGILPAKTDWYLAWADLTEASVGEKIDRAGKMATVNATMKDSGELIFTPEEIRATVDLEPLSDAEKYRDDQNEDDEVDDRIVDPEAKPEPKAP